MRFFSRLAATLAAATSAFALTACSGSSSHVATITTTTLNLPAIGDSGRAQDSGTNRGSEEVLDSDSLWDNTTEIPQAERPDPRVDLAQPEAAEYFMTAGVLTPGVAIYNADSSGRCSAGHFVGDGERLFILTAGHCGDQGDTFFYKDRAGDNVKIGEMVLEARNTNTDRINSADIALIEVSNPAAQVSTSPALNAPLAGWMPLEDFALTKPTICRAGSTRGVSCGNFIDRHEDQGLFTFGNDSAPGDSGGPVYASIDGKLWAVGVLSFGNDQDPSDVEVGAMEIGNTMKQFDLKLYA